jgi:signal peptidase
VGGGGTGVRREAVFRRPVRRLAQALTLGVLLVAGGVVVLAVLVPRVAGATPYTVLTGSMAPAHPPGTLVVVRPTDEVEVGDVVTYQLRSGRPTVVTHRVVGLAWDGAGERRYQLQGDANSAPDAELVRQEQLRGRVWYALPWGGRLTTLIDPERRRLVSQVAAGGLLAYAAVMLWRTGRDRGRSAGRGGADVLAPR